jgi:hypothetical protein
MPNIVTDPTVPTINLPAYKTYVALLTQSGTDAPAAIVLESSLSGPVVWTRVAAGHYEGTLAGEFTLGKTIIYPFTQSSFQVIPIYKNTWLDFGYTMDNPSVNAVRLFVVDNNGDNTEMNNAVDANSLLVEIRVYP